MLNKENSFHSDRNLEYLPIKFIGSNRAVGEIPPVDKNSVSNITEVNN